MEKQGKSDSHSKKSYCKPTHKIFRSCRRAVSRATILSIFTILQTIFMALQAGFNLEVRILREFKVWKIHCCAYHCCSIWRCYYLRCRTLAKPLQVKYAFSEIAISVEILIWNSNCSNSNGFYYWRIINNFNKFKHSQNMPANIMILSWPNNFWIKQQTHNYIANIIDDSKSLNK